MEYHRLVHSKFNTHTVAEGTLFSPWLFLLSIAQQTLFARDWLSILPSSHTGVQQGVFAGKKASKTYASVC